MIKKIELNNKLVLALRSQNISFDKVLEQVVKSIAKKTGGDFRHLTGVVVFYGANANVQVKYELKFNDTTEEIELTIGLDD